MTVSIKLTPEAEAKLREYAALQGRDVADLVREAVEEKLAVPASFRELLTPIHEQTRQSDGADQEELDRLVEELRDEAHKQKKGRRTA